MVGVNGCGRETGGEAGFLFTSPQQGFTNAIRGRRSKLQPPIDDIEDYWTAPEKAHVTQMLACSFVGSAETVKRGLARFIGHTQADELIVAAAIYDHAAWLRSYAILPAIAGNPGTVSGNNPQRRSLLLL